MFLVFIRSFIRLTIRRLWELSMRVIFSLIGSWLELLLSRLRSDEAGNSFFHSDEISSWFKILFTEFQVSYRAMLLSFRLAARYLLLLIYDSCSSWMRRMIESRYFLSVRVEVDTIGNFFFDPDIIYSVFLAESSCSSESRLSFVKAFKEL